MKNEELSLSLMETKERQTPAEPSTRTQAADTHRFQAWSSTCWQFLRFCLVGGVNTGVDVLILNALLLGLPTNNVQVLVLYNSVAYSSGAVSSFFLNKYWTFGHKRTTTGREVVRFAISLALAVLYSNALVWLAGKALQPLIANATLWGNASKLVAVAGTAVISYTCMRFWTFAGGSQDRPKKQETVHRQPLGLLLPQHPAWKNRHSPLQQCAERLSDHPDASSAGRYPQCPNQPCAS